MHSTISGTVNSFAGAPQNVTQAIHQASTRTGVDFSYLMNQAKAESSFNPEAKAKTSSATGLYQFIESTWLRMVKTHGHKYGLQNEANQITQNPQTGRISVSSPAAREAILDLRTDPKLASSMAAELAAENKTYLETKVKGMDIGSTELYFAHFLGAGGASSFLNQLDAAPHSIAAHHFPKAAGANRNVFYDPATAQPRTMQQVYDFFDKKFGGEYKMDNASTMAANSASAKGGIGNAENFMSYTRSLPNPLSSNAASGAATSLMGMNAAIRSQEHLYLSALMALPTPLDNQSENGTIGSHRNKNIENLNLFTNKVKNPEFIQSLI